MPRETLAILLENNAPSIERIVERLSVFAAARGAEVILIENASVDGTLPETLARKRDEWILIRHSQRRRPGECFCESAAIALGEWIMLLPAGAFLDVPADEFMTLFDQARDVDAVLGIRKALAFADNWRRLTDEKLCRLLFRLFAGQYVSDPTTPFAVYRRDAVRGIALTGRGGVFTGEVALRLVRKGAKIRDFPVNAWIPLGTPLERGIRAVNLFVLLAASWTGKTAAGALRLCREKDVAGKFGRGAREFLISFGAWLRKLRLRPGF